MKPWTYLNPDARLSEQPPKKKRSNGSGCVVILFAVSALCALLCFALQTYFESRAYNRLTGAQTTYWDALWLELRVDASPQPDKH